MKAPNLDSFSVSRPLVQFGHWRGSPPSARGGNRCGASSASSASITCGDFQVLGLVDRADEVAPEIAQHVAPRHLVVGDEIELLLEAGREIVFDVFGEEAFEEGDDDAAAVLRIEPALVEPHIFAVLEHLQDRGVGRGPADAELFQALDQRGLGIARRRLGEMLGRRRSSAWSAARRRSSAAGGATPRRRGLRPGLPDRARGSRRTSPPCRWRAVRGAGPRPSRVISAVVRSSSADSIWLATVRSQISS